MARVEIPAPGDLIMDEAGNVRVGVTVSLTLAGTVTAATHYSALTGGTSATGGLVTASDGTIVNGAGNRRYVTSGQALDLTIAGRTRQIEPNSASAESGILYVAAPTGVAATDRAAIQAAIDEAETTAKRVQLGPGVYIVDTTITHRSGVHVWGTGRGGDLFYTDALFGTPTGTTVRLANGTTADLWKTENHASLTGVASPSTYDVPQHAGLHHLKLDANVVGGCSGYVARIYCRSWETDHVDFVGGALGGVTTEIPGGGYDMEQQWSNFRITYCGGRSLFTSAHDSQFTNGIVSHPSGSAAGTDGIYVDSAQGGGEQFTNVHAWGGYTNAQWVLGSTNAYYTNCTADGGGIQILGSGNTFYGTIYGTNTPGQWVVKLGDGTVRTIGRNKVDARVFNFKASPFAVQTLNTVDDGNRFEATANMGGVVRYGSKGNVYTLTSSAITSDVTLNVNSTADLPASGTLYADDGTNRTASLAYTGKTSTTLTGVTVIPAAGLANGAALWLASGFSGASDLGFSSFKVWNYDATTNAGQILERATPTSQSGHTAEHTFTGIYSPVEGVKLGSGGTQIKKHLSATASWDPPSVVNGASTTTTITVTGAALGDTVAVGFTSLVTGWNITGLVTATNTVEVRITNNTGGTVDLASGTLRADVWQH
jgi:hypothetical protein